MLVQCVHDVSMARPLVLSLFVAGLFGGMTHCTGMCSPFIFAQVDGVNRKSSHLLFRLVGGALIPYHLGRIFTYTLIALLLAGVLNIAFLFQPLKTFLVVPMLVLAGVIFLVNAFPKLSSIFPWVSYIRVSMPYRWFSKASGRLANHPGVMKRFFLGVLLGFMPCGLVVSAVMAAATAEKLTQTGVAMVAFGFGTAVPLIGLAWGGGMLMNTFPVAGKRLRQGAMALSAFWLFVLAGRFVFSAVSI